MLPGWCPLPGISGAVLCMNSPGGGAAPIPPAGTPHVPPGQDRQDDVHCLDSWTLTVFNSFRLLSSVVNTDMRNISFLEVGKNEEKKIGQQMVKICSNLATCL